MQMKEEQYNSTVEEEEGKTQERAQSHPSDKVMLELGSEGWAGPPGEDRRPLPVTENGRLAWD